MKRILFILVATFFSHVAFSDYDFSTTLQDAKAGNTSAQVRLGIAYEDGDGVAQDYQQAKFWYESAAEKGNSSAQFLLGCLYDFGHGMKKDVTQAVYWYEKSAAQGNDSAQYSLGSMYENGRGVTQDYQEAKNRYLLSANQGNENAQKALIALEQKARSNDQKPVAYAESVVTATDANLGNFPEASVEEVIMKIYPEGSRVSVTSKLGCLEGRFYLSGKGTGTLAIISKNDDFTIPEKKHFVSQCNEKITVKGVVKKDFMGMALVVSLE